MKVNITLREFEEMLKLAETNDAMLNAFEQLKIIYTLSLTPEKLRKKEKLRAITEAMYKINIYKK